MQRTEACGFGRGSGSWRALETPGPCGGCNAQNPQPGPCSLPLGVVQQPRSLLPATGEPFVLLGNPEGSAGQGGRGSPLRGRGAAGADLQGVSESLARFSSVGDTVGPAGGVGSLTCRLNRSCAPAPESTNAAHLSAGAFHFSLDFRYLGVCIGLIRCLGPLGGGVPCREPGERSRARRRRGEQAGGRRARRTLTSLLQNSSN